MTQTKTLFTDSSCEYFTKQSYNNMLVEEQSRLNLNTLTAVTLKQAFLFSVWTFVVYLINHRLRNFLGQLWVKPPTVGISKTWFVDCYHFSDFMGYISFLSKFIPNKKKIN